MFSSPNTVKLVDFGFSCIATRDQLLETFCGSPPYAAPELFRYVDYCIYGTFILFSDKSYSGELVDIWALGVLLFFMLVGVTPFKGETVADMKVMIMEGKFQLPDYISIMAGDLIKGMLRTETEKRADIEFVKKNFWMRDCRFTKSYLSIKANVKVEDESEKSAINDRVWRIMNNYGITKEMLVEENMDKGPRDAVIGTYRIVQFQVQGEMAKMAKDKDTPPPTSSSFTNGSPIAQHNTRKLRKSRTCSIL
uniref:Protein kinase domain-containing protein n=1 Tax=Caenorhabditis tropicalis TaxID=1561998 RepID=A0A1I7U1J1_9PELO